MQTNLGLQARCGSTVAPTWYVGILCTCTNLLFLLNSHLDAILKSTDWITRTESTWVKPSLKSNPSERRIFELALLSNLNGDFFFFFFWIYTHMYIYSVNRFCSKQILLIANMLGRTCIQKYTKHVQYTLMVIMHVFNSSFWLIHNFDNNLYYDPPTVNHLFIFIMSQSRWWQ